ncbi:hypothetical protein ACFLV7_01650 [Chloroflexota bacterium]
MHFPEEQPKRARFVKIDISAGELFDYDKLGPEVYRAIEEGMKAGYDMIIERISNIGKKK